MTDLPEQSAIVIDTLFVTAAVGGAFEDCLANLSFSRGMPVVKRASRDWCLKAY